MQSYFLLRNLNRLLLGLTFVIVYKSSYSQAPLISYSSGIKSFVAGRPVTPLTPINTGGTISSTPYGYVNIVAGSSSSGAVDAMGTSASFNIPMGIIADKDGNVYVADSYNNKIRKITPTGVVSTFAGSGEAGSADGSALSASFKQPYGVAIDGQNNIYVADYGNNKIRKISNGVVSSFAGTGVAGSLNGAVGSATFDKPYYLAADKDGNVYVSNYIESKIRKISNGVVSAFVGGSDGFLDGTGSNAKFYFPAGMACDADGNLYVADGNNHAIRKVTPAGVVTTIAGSGVEGLKDGNEKQAMFAYPRAVSVHDGDVYVADMRNDLIRRVKSDGTVTTISGVTGYGNYSTEGSETSYYYPLSIAADLNGSLYVVENRNQIRKINIRYNYSITPNLPEGLNFDATTGTISGIPQSTSANSIYSIKAINSSGSSTALVELEVISENAPKISTVANSYKFNLGTSITPIVISNSGGSIPFGETATYAGNGTSGFTVGKGSEVAFRKPSELTVDASGAVYISDQGNNRIRKALPSGEVKEFAGNSASNTYNSTAEQSSIGDPKGLAIDKNGNVFISQWYNCNVRKVNTNLIVSTFAGNSNEGYIDGAGATARFNRPASLAFDSKGNLFVADEWNNLIRKIAPDGTVSTFAGNNSNTIFADGAVDVATFKSPSGIAIDSEDNIYVADAGNHRVRKITPEGMVSTYAGTGLVSPFKDGAALSATFYSPYDVSVDKEGSVYVADRYNNKIRMITKSGIVSTLAGSGSYSGIDGLGTSATFAYPRGVANDNRGHIFVADTDNNKVRRVCIKGYSISPALPAGLNLDAKTGIISGTPVGDSGPVTYKIKAENYGGSDSTYISITAGAGALPVELVQFAVKRASVGKNLVYWKTAAEINSSIFIVKRAGEDMDFKGLTSIQTLGKAAEYQFVDDRPLAGINYYQLIQVDNNGEEHNYGTKHIYNTLNSISQFAVFPNPVTGHQLHITFDKVPLKVNIQLYSLDGRLLMNKECSPATDISLSLSSTLGTGIYLLKVNDEQMRRLFVN
jgi:sugar lactone lactonase YvrE